MRSIAGNRIVKAFGMENWESNRFRDAAKKLFRANVKSVAAQAVSSPLMDIIGALAIALLLWLGRSQINRGAMTPDFHRFHHCGFPALRSCSQNGFF